MLEAVKQWCSYSRLVNINQNICQMTRRGEQKHFNEWTDQQSTVYGRTCIDGHFIIIVDMQATVVSGIHIKLESVEVWIEKPKWNGHVNGYTFI